MGVLKFEDLSEGMRVTGKVKNVVDFGAFIDIGIKESALIHVSELSNQFVRDPMEVLKVGDVKEFVIISLDETRRRIGLSLKAAILKPTKPSSLGRDQARQPLSGEGVRHERVQAVAKNSAKPMNPVKAKGRETQAPREDDGMTYNPFANLLKKGERK
jgi:uncharacterized protein